MRGNVYQTETEAVSAAVQMGMKVGQHIAAVACTAIGGTSADLFHEKGKPA